MHIGLRLVAFPLTVDAYKRIFISDTIFIGYYNTVCAPVLAVLALWSAVGHWNAWFDALLYVSDRDKLVLQLVLRRILTGGPSDIGDLNIQMFQGTMLETVKAATIVVTIGPIILVYPFLQRYFVKGLLIGALKG